MSEMNIGQVARLTGVPSKTIRYYEDVGLLPAAKRAPNGYRIYGQRTADVLCFVKRSRALGFSVDEVAALLALWDDANRSSAEVRALAEQHLASVEQKIEELQQMRHTLLDLVSRCHGDDRPDCPILDDLAMLTQPPGIPLSAPASSATKAKSTKAKPIPNPNPNPVVRPVAPRQQERA